MVEAEVYLVMVVEAEVLLGQEALEVMEQILV
jgi:hypothetical protein